MLNFDFLEKGLGKVSHPNFVIFQEKCFSCYLLLTDEVAFTSWDIDICIAIVCFPG